MLYLLYGDDAFSIRETLVSLKGEVEPEELRDVNVTVVDGARARFDEVTALCDTVPFLADRRLVIVEGLLSRFEPRRPSRGGGASARSREVASEGWEKLPEYVARMPETTHLVLVDGRLSEANPHLRKLRTLGRALAFPQPSGGELSSWIRNRAADKGAQIEPRAVSMLADTIGGDLQVIDNELEKLTLFCRGRAITHEEVQDLVAYAKEANIFAAVDAVVEGRPEAAVRLVHRLIDSGSPPAYLLTMLARQVRLLILAKELRAERRSQSRIGERLRLSGFPLRKTLEQEAMFTAEALSEIYHRLVETDVSVKTGVFDERTALDVLIVELAASAGSARRTSVQRVRS